MIHSYHQDVKTVFAKGCQQIMGYHDIAISQEQAQQLAKAVIADIEGYIKQHLSEYKAFLKSEGYPESEVDKMAS